MSPTPIIMTDNQEKNINNLVWHFDWKKKTNTACWFYFLKKPLFNYFFYLVSYFKNEIYLKILFWLFHFFLFFKDNGGKSITLKLKWIHWKWLYEHYYETFFSNDNIVTWPNSLSPCLILSTFSYNTDDSDTVIKLV